MDGLCQVESTRMVESNCFPAEIIIIHFNCCKSCFNVMAGHNEAYMLITVSQLVGFHLLESKSI